MKTRRDFLKVAALAPLAVTGLVAMPAITKASLKTNRILDLPNIIADIDFMWNLAPERWGCYYLDCFALNCTEIRLYNPNEDPNYYYTVPAEDSTKIGLIPRIWCKETGCPEEYCTVDNPSYKELLTYGTASRAAKDKHNPQAWESWAWRHAGVDTTTKCPTPGYFNLVADWLEQMVVKGIEAKLKYSKYQLGTVKVDYSEVDNSVQCSAPNQIRSYVEYRHKRKQSGLENVSVYYKQC